MGGAVKKLKIHSDEVLWLLRPEDEEAATWLKTSIEKLSYHRPMWSRSAYTSLGTIHHVFLNGAVKGEMEVGAPPWDDAERLVRKTFDLVLAYRQEFPGYADLVWRVEPEMKRSEAGISCYVRLSFEPSLMPVGDGMWRELTYEDA